MKQAIIVCFFLLVMSRVSVIHADYVLPYPSYMPGNTLYTVSRMIDAVKKYWYWGTIATIKYQLGLSDKYLVEAKTLFEYKQYFLGMDALRRSNKALPHLVDLVGRGTNEGKDMQAYSQQIVDAMNVHIEVLTDMRKQTPDTFSWTPEKRASTELSIGDEINQSIVTRQAIVNALQQREKAFSLVR